MKQIGDNNIIIYNKNMLKLNILTINNDDDLHLVAKKL